jgi:hypothetical protein
MSVPAMAEARRGEPPAAACELQHSAYYRAAGPLESTHTATVEREGRIGEPAPGLR